MFLRRLSVPLNHYQSSNYIHASCQLCRASVLTSSACFMTISKATVLKDLSATTPRPLVRQRETVPRDSLAKYAGVLPRAWSAPAMFTALFPSSLIKARLPHWAVEINRQTNQNAELLEGGAGRLANRPIRPCCFPAGITEGILWNRCWLRKFILGDVKSLYYHNIHKFAWIYLFKAAGWMGRIMSRQA